MYFSWFLVKLVLFELGLACGFCLWILICFDRVQIDLGHCDLLEF
uniref:Uncharacterized protein n=1 Tax=Rhizophora mucronata TaxID=61149 RepID=A0A2P2JBM5_RHIMU